MTRAEAELVIRGMKNGMGFSDEENDEFWSYTYDGQTKKFNYLKAWTVIGSVLDEAEYSEGEFADLLVSEFEYRTVMACSFSSGHAASPEEIAPKSEPEDTTSTDHTSGQDGPIHRAAMYGSLENLKLLVAKGVSVNISGSYGRTPLMYAAADAKSPEMVQFLLQSGADVNAKNEGGDNALFDAVSRGETSTEVAARLLDAGLDIGYVHPNYKTILSWAANCGRKDIVELLLARGADVNAQNDRNESPIAQAMMNNHREIVKLLFAAGADPESRNFGGWSLLEYATEKKDQDLVRGIMAKKTSGKAGDEALAKAAEKGDVDMLALLVSQGANVNGHSRWGNETPLIKAAYYGKTAAVEWLLNHHAEIEARDSRGNTAILHAAWMGQRDVAALLLKKGADVNAINHLGWNALMQAALEGHHEVARLLLEHGARSDFIDKEKGASAYYLAERSGSQQTLAVLKEFGAKPRQFRTLHAGEAFVDIRDCEYCQYIPQRKDIAREESLGDYPGLVELHSVSTEVDRYATQTIDLFRCKLCGTYYQHDHYIDTEDDFIAGPSIHRHLQRMNFLRLQMNTEANEFSARLPQLLQQMRDALARDGSEIHSHFLPFFVENVVDAYLVADDWQSLTQNLLNHRDKKLALYVADDLITTYGNGQYTTNGPEQDYKAYRHITPVVFNRTQKLLSMHRVAFWQLLHDIAAMSEHAEAAKKVIESAAYYNI